MNSLLILFHLSSIQSVAVGVWTDSIKLSLDLWGSWKGVSHKQLCTSSFFDLIPSGFVDFQVIRQEQSTLWDVQGRDGLEDQDKKKNLIIK